MEFWDVLKERKSIRKYSKRAVSQRKLRRLQRALQIAPTGGNRQDFAFIFVTDEKVRARLAKRAGHQDFIGEAPVIMAAVCPPGGGFNVAIAVDHMTLAAANEGLGTCWIGWFERDEAKKILRVPDDKEVAILVTVGHPAETPDARKRKPLKELIMQERYRKP